MAQSALTVTPPNPTPPTNFGFTGATPPNVPNYTKASYANMANMTAIAADGSGGRPQAPYGVNPSPPPYYDDGAAASVYVFAANAAALASGTGATSGGTENTYPGTGAGPGNFLGAVPASTSVAHEGAGTELSATGANNVNYTYPGGGVLDTNKSVSCGPVLVKATTDAGAPVNPNQNHASSLSKATNPALTTIAPTTSVHGTAAITMTATGTNFTPQSRIVIAGVPQNTTFVSATSLTCLATPPAAAGTPAVTVVTGGVVTTAPQTWTIT
jgi:hypothetical protein